MSLRYLLKGTSYINEYPCNRGTVWILRSNPQLVSCQNEGLVRVFKIQNEDALGHVQTQWEEGYRLSYEWSLAGQQVHPDIS